MGRGIAAGTQAVAAFGTLPLRLEQAPPRSSTVWRLLLASPAVVGLAVAVIGAIMDGADQPSALALITQRPVASAQIGVALAIWIALFVWPASLAIAGFWTRRTVDITDQGVHITDAGFGRARTIVVPLESYLGIAHHIRASLSGLTHELILVHPETASNVTLLTADHIPQATFESARHLLNLVEVPARLLYERKSALQIAAPTRSLRPIGA